MTSARHHPGVSMAGGSWPATGTSAGRADRPRAPGSAQNGQLHFHPRRWPGRRACARARSANRRCPCRTACGRRLHTCARARRTPGLRRPAGPDTSKGSGRRSADARRTSYRGPTFASRSPHDTSVTRCSLFRTRVGIGPCESGRSATGTAGPTSSGAGGGRSGASGAEHHGGIDQPRDADSSDGPPAWAISGATRSPRCGSSAGAAGAGRGPSAQPQLGGHEGGVDHVDVDPLGPQPERGRSLKADRAALDDG